MFLTSKLGNKKIKIHDKFSGTLLESKEVNTAKIKNSVYSSIMNKEMRNGRRYELIGIRFLIFLKSLSPNYKIW